MKKFLYTLLLSISIVSISVAQTPEQSVLKQANDMGQSFLDKDYDTFATYTHPKVMKAMGGKDNMVKNLKRSFDGFENEGVSFLGTDYSAPSKIITVEDGTMQCTLIQMIEMKVKGGKLTSQSCLLAISENKGKNWYFLDTAGYNHPTMKTLIPNLSDEIVIPGRIDPVFEPDEKTPDQE
ncbi:hypothetical protein [Flavobacterium sp.]|uniref:hypothetical protein n=1 Tax=Flavobacterium sp. TaxID=239 RepID=UPI003A92F652